MTPVDARKLLRLVRDQHPDAVVRVAFGYDEDLHRLLIDLGLVVAIEQNAWSEAELVVVDLPPDVADSPTA